ncbi:MAG TPA: glycoside hydrolase family 140 protein [Spirillospora sp.]|nr:glycoside hydrolase family 140 protein [Spirillospora sp.]
MPQHLYVSANRRFLVTASGQPFFWLGDTAWELFHRCDRDEAEHYLENRRQKGFNVVQAVILAELDGLRDPNPYGDLPLIDGDPTRPNEAYFQHVDYVIDLAAQKDIYIGLLPTWGDKVNLQGGRGPVIFNPQNAFAYGRYLAERYRDRENIIWINGGDRHEVTDGVDYAPVFRALAAGILSGYDLPPLIGYHPRGPGTSSTHFHDDNWLSFNMWQTGHRHRELPVWDMIGGDYARTPVKPAFNGEPAYEDLPVAFRSDAAYGFFDAYDVRRIAYWSVFAGGFGHTYGHNAVWQMHTDKRAGVIRPLPYTWPEAIDRPGAGQMVHLKNLMLSRPFLSRIPDQSVLVSDAGTGGRRVQATRDAEGRYAFVYVPDRQSVQVQTDWLGGDRLKAWWYDPRGGTAQLIGEFQKGPNWVFSAPADGPDWVLVLDDAAAGFPAPGLAAKNE